MQSRRRGVAQQCSLQVKPAQSNTMGNESKIATHHVSSSSTLLYMCCSRACSSSCLCAHARRLRAARDRTATSAWSNAWARAASSDALHMHRRCSVSPHAQPDHTARALSRTGVPAAASALPDLAAPSRSPHGYQPWHTAAPPTLPWHFATHPATPAAGSPCRPGLQPRRRMQPRRLVADQAAAQHRCYNSARDGQVS